MIDILPRREEVRLESSGGEVRRYLVEEFTIERCAEFVRLLDQVRASQARLTDDADNFEAILFEEIGGLAEPLLSMVLCNPIGGPPIDPEFLAGVRLSQRKQVLDLQCKFNELEEISGKLASLLTQIHAIRLARMLVEPGGPTSSTSLPPDTESTPSPSPGSGPEDSASPTGGELFGPNGESKSFDSSLPAPSPDPSPTSESSAPPVS